MTISISDYFEPLGVVSRVFQCTFLKNTLFTRRSQLMVRKLVALRDRQQLFLLRLICLFGMWLPVMYIDGNMCRLCGQQ